MKNKNNVVYNGLLYRVQEYSPNNKGHIYETEYYQAWSKSLDGISNVTNYCGNVLLIRCNAKNGIDVFELLIFFLKYNYITHCDDFHQPKELARYEYEQEVEFPMLFKYITDVTIIEKEQILNWEKMKIEVPIEKWRRNKLN